jgi:hypothetical protein
MENVKELIGKENYLILSKKLLHRKSSYALQRLDENLRRLYARHAEYQNIEKIFMNNLYYLGKQYNLDDAQFLLLDKMESLFQQVYSTISALILVINYVGFSECKQDFPNRSVTKFLNFIKTNPSNISSGIEAELDLLIYAVYYRDNFIDHPQGKPALNWMTYGYTGKYVIIYYPPEITEVIAITDNFDPYEKNFQPCINTKEFYVSPDKDRTILALQQIIRTLLVSRISKAESGGH